MELYSYEDIKRTGNCRDFAKDVLNLQVNNEGRCAAIWRGGSNPNSVSLEKDVWSDHGNGGAGGSIIDLCALVKFGGIDKDEMQLAAEFLGQYYNLVPMSLGKPKTNSRYDQLIAEGYTVTARYNYRDIDGNGVLQVVRLEHSDPGKKKEFLQRTEKGWGLRGVSPILYNLTAITQSDWIILVEGEKDADNLIKLGFPATTVCGGAKKWDDSYRETFKDKDVVLLPDNDEVGKTHVYRIASELFNYVNQIKVVTVSDKPKGDVSDYLEDHTINDLIELITNAPLFTQTDLLTEDQYAVSEAKEANKGPIRNFYLIKKEIGKQQKVDKQPRQINDLLSEINRRFLNFPRKVGEQAFDHDRDTGRIVYINKPAAFFAWMMRKSGQRVEWSRNEGCVSEAQFFEGMIANAHRYEAISQVPDWPTRPDVYYAHSPLPSPTPDHSALDKLLSFFEPANDDFKILIAAFFSAPLFYIHGIPRPCWIIDSEDGHGTGKSTLVEVCAALYGSNETGGQPIKTNKQELKMNIGDLIKRLVSSEGRQARVLLLDNVTGCFSSSEFSDLVTAPSVSGKAPYGRGEETRPNNLTYTITANSADVDNDIACRSYYIMLKRPAYQLDWKTKLQEYVRENRMQILSDIIDILESHEAFHIAPRTRCPEFEVKILQPHCASLERYESVMSTLESVRSESNVEEEQARRIIEIVTHELTNIQVMPGQPVIDPAKVRVFIRSEVLEKWIKRELNCENVMQTIRNLAKMGHLPVNNKTRRYPHRGSGRSSGALWEESKAEEIITIGKIGPRTIGVVHV